MSAEEYLSYVDRIRGCRGHDIQWQTRAIGVSHHIYLDNAQELVAVLVPQVAIDCSQEGGFVESLFSA